MVKTTQIHVGERTQNTCPLGVGEWYCREVPRDIQIKPLIWEIKPVAKPVVPKLIGCSKFSKGVTRLKNLMGCSEDQRYSQN